MFLPEGPVVSLAATDNSGIQFRLDQHSLRALQEMIAERQFCDKSMQAYNRPTAISYSLLYRAFASRRYLQYIRQCVHGRLIDRYHKSHELGPKQENTVEWVQCRGGRVYVHGSAVQCMCQVRRVLQQAIPYPVDCTRKVTQCTPHRRDCIQCLISLSTEVRPTSLGKMCQPESE